MSDPLITADNDFAFDPGVEATVASAEAVVSQANVSTSEQVQRRLWRALYHFNLYRMVLSGGLVMLSLANAPISDFGSRSSALFLFASIMLCVVSLTTMITINRGRPGFKVQATLQLVADIVLITLLMHASNGVTSSLGLLLLVSVAATGVVLPGAITLCLAAFASVCVILESLIPLLVGMSDEFMLPRITILCIGLFATAIIMSVFSERIRRAEELADQRALDLLTLAQINAHIVAQLDSGVVITDEHDRVYFTNEKACSLLGIQGTGVGAKLADLNDSLGDAADRWSSDSPDEEAIIELGGSAERITPRFLPASAEHSGMLIFLDSLTLTEEKAQQLKLASLGRLTAAISHEIRNPLSAISHAGQLLDESDKIGDDDRHLLNIIIAQSGRINTIIKSVLQFSRRAEMTRQTFELKSWCEAQAEDIAMSHNLPPRAIEIRGEPVDVKINSGQLQQILGNLCDNAIRHSPEYAGESVVILEIDISDTGSPTMDVIDSGSGIDEATVQHLFEPFFTTHAAGTGLGLYICRELCEANGASLNYIPDDAPGSRFRVNFDNSNENG